jgi:hypothetical protein
MYRPTVRMDDRYEEYVNLIFRATPNEIDRNKILRLMMFAAPFSGFFQSEVSRLLLPDVLLPSPPWSRSDSDLWRLSEAPGEQGKGASIRASIGSYREAL